METQIVPSESLDTSNHYESAVDAIDGQRAIGTILWDIVNGESKGVWDDKIIDGLFVAQRILNEDCLRHLDEYRHEHWRAHALLGAYGDAARQKALNEENEKKLA